MSDLPALWTPSKFDGSDLLPVLRPKDPNAEQLVGRENVSTTDLVLPSLRLLQGMSPPVTEGLEGAQPGKIFHSATQQVIKPPFRVLVVHHSKSNMLIPDPIKDPRTAGLERCLSRDTVRGNVYGLCEECRRCTEWGKVTPQHKNGEPPMGSQSHNFVAMTEFGPAVMRFGRTSFNAGKQFITNWMMSEKNLWAHPVVVRVKAKQRTLPNGQPATFFVWELLWQSNDTVPPAMREAALVLHKQVDAAYQAGRLSGDDEGEDTQE
jgi:hypothetical protein